MKVAKSVHGMHVYGWPINAKLAKYNWDIRRASGTRGERKRFDEASGGRGADRPPSEVSQNQSFAEVVRGPRMVGKEERKGTPLSMSWRKHKQSSDWLSRCAIGSLKEFSSISNVNKRLRDRDFSFSSAYVGARNILWQFGSEIEKTGFIKNRFFWDDFFSSMTDWSEKWTPKGKLCWINVFGVPLSYWEESFFKKVGSLVGEPLWVDKETSLRTRLDRGKILAVIPQTWDFPRDVSVYTEEASFNVKIEIDTTPVSMSWLNHFLELEDFSPINFHSASPENSLCSVDSESQEGRDIDKGMDKSQLFGAAKMRRSKFHSDKSSLKDDCSLPKTVRFQNCGVCGTLTDVDKGKKQWVRIPRPHHSPRSNRNAKIVIRDDLVRQTNQEQEVDSSTSASDSERRPHLEQEEGELISYRANSLGQGVVTHKRITGITIDLMGEDENEDILGQNSLKPTDQGMSSSENRSHSDKSGKFSSSILQKEAEVLSQPKTPNKKRG
ncbi:hypothetical protein Q3G72_016106 [Acer saccharum]|nr:hypothetical protein Q3G72_016106 [Acer saccharum]